MSAIFGFVNFDGAFPDPVLLGRMSEAMAMFGTDRASEQIEGAVALGHRLMAVPRSDRAPCRVTSRDDGEVVITADARLDNREDLFAVLGIGRDRQNWISDSDLILLCYRKWGVDCASRLLGDFAYSIYDRRAGRIFAARDPFGVRPFYYHRGSGRFAFASALRGLFALPGVPIEIDDLDAACFLVVGVIDGDRSFYRDIQVLPAGHSLIVDPEGQSRLEPFWELDPDRELSFRDERDCAEQLAALMREAVRARLVDGNPNSVMLSGGLDSSSVASLAAELISPRTLIGMTGVIPERFVGLEPDERHYAEILEQHIPNLEATYVDADNDDPLSGIERSLDVHRTPYMLTGSHYKVDALFGMAGRKNCAVFLTGTGGDITSSCHGSGYLAELFTQGRMYRLIQELLAKGKNVETPLMTLFRSEVVTRVMPERLWSIVARNRYGQKWRSQTAISDDLATQTRVIDHLRSTQSDEFVAPRPPSVRRQQYLSLQSARRCAALYPWTLDGATHRLEVAHPLIDTRIAEFALAAPTAMKIRDGLDRRMARQSVRSILPDAIRERREKTLFCPEFPRKLREVRRRLRDEISEMSRSSAIGRYVDILRMGDICDQLDSEVETDDRREHLLTALTLAYGFSRFVVAAERWRSDRNETDAIRFVEGTDGITSAQ